MLLVINLRIPSRGIYTENKFSIRKYQRTLILGNAFCNFSFHFFEQTCVIWGSIWCWNARNYFKIILVKFRKWIFEEFTLKSKNLNFETRKIPVFWKRPGTRNFIRVIKSRNVTAVILASFLKRLADFRNRWRLIWTFRLFKFYSHAREPIKTFFFFNFI